MRTDAIAGKAWCAAAAVVLAVTAGTVTPVVSPVVAQAAPAATAAPVLTWGEDELDAALVIEPTVIVPTPTPTPGGNDDSPTGAAAAAPWVNYWPGNAVGPAPGPAELIQVLVQAIADGIAGIVQGAVAIVGTTAYVAIAFTGGVITAVGDFLPGPLGQVLVNMATSVNNVANTVAEVLRVGPYATSTA